MTKKEFYYNNLTPKQKRDFIGRVNCTQPAFSQIMRDKKQAGFALASRIAAEIKRRTKRGETVFLTLQDFEPKNAK